MKKETGLMFKAPLVRAILSGQKTQERRVMANQPAGQTFATVHAREVSGGFQWHSKLGESSVFKCPMGQPGDRIYVRETFARVPTVCGSDDLIFAADYQDGSDKAAGVKYTPAIHMPKELARIWLEITGVRVERLQDISEADCVAEGASGGMGLMTGAAHFRHIWESTGGDWAANPWVWVIDFKRIERPAAQKGQ